MYKWIYKVNRSKQEMENAFQYIYMTKRQLSSNIRLDKYDSCWSLNVVVSYVKGYKMSGFYNIPFDVYLLMQDGKINVSLNVDNALKNWRFNQIVPSIFFSIVSFIIAFAFRTKAMGIIKIFLIIGVILLITGCFGLAKIIYSQKKTQFGMSDDEAIMIIETSQKLKDQVNKMLNQIIGSGKLETTCDFACLYWKK